MVGTLVLLFSAVMGTAGAANPAPPAVARVHLQILNQHSYLQLRLNGKGPFVFLLDTGASGVLVTSDVAMSLHLPVMGRFTGGGGGANRIHYTRSRLHQIAVGGATLQDVNVVVAPKAFDYFPDVEGVRCDGVIGYDLFAKYVATIDSAAQTLKLWPIRAAPREYPGKSVAFTFGSINQPVVDGAIDGMPGPLWVDTGFRGSVLLFSPFVRKHAAALIRGPSIVTTTSWGLGGPVKARLARGRVKIGSHALNDVILQLSMSAAGFDASTEGAGLVGAGVFRHYVVTLDYARRLIYMHPIDRFADSWDRLGLWINWSRDAFKVMDVVRRGPADDAGVHVGDFIEAVGGTPARRMTLSKARDLFRDPAHSVVRLTIERDGTIRTVDVHERSLI